MSKTIKIRTKVVREDIEVKMLLRHPMNVGRKLKNGESIPAHFIKELVCEYENELVMQAHWGAGISKNPYVAFTIKNAKAGGNLVVKWTDNQGETDTLKTTT